jgi:polar amino acid transport system permease protein
LGTTVSVNFVLNRLWTAFQISLELFVWTVLVATIIGIIFTVLNFVPYVRLLTTAIVTVIRGLPLMLLLILVYYGLAFYGLFFEMIFSCVVAFGICYGAYWSEIFRSGINAVPKGQWEASKVLGLSKTRTFVFVIMPQAFKKILPSWGNEWHTLIKGTSVACIIGLGEITREAKNLVSYTTYLYPLLLTSVFYLAFSALITVVFKLIERGLNYYNG